MQRLLSHWDKLRSSFWFLPGVMTAGAALFSWVSLWVDSEQGDLAAMEVLRTFIGGPEAAREALGVIAGSMITIAGVTFSITVVALVLASNQYAPRVLRNYMRDPGNQLVLGAFVATFLYTLLVLRSVRSEGDGYVPVLSVTLALVFAVANLGFYIYFIHHISTSMRASQILREIAHDTHGAIARVFDGEVDEGGPTGGLPEAGLARAADREDLSALGTVRFEPSPEPGEWPVPATLDGHVQRVDVDRLVEVARRTDRTMELLLRPGDFCSRGVSVARLDAEPEAPEEVAREVRGAFLLGSGRTLAQDPAFGFRQLVDIAVKALSPGINDPTTAGICVDYLGSLLIDLGGRPWPEPVRRDGDGVVRVRLPQGAFADYVDLAFTEIRLYAASDLAVTLRLLMVLARIARVVDGRERREPLWKVATAVAAGADGGLTVAADRERVDRALAHLAEILGEDPEQYRLE